MVEREQRLKKEQARVEVRVVLCVEMALFDIVFLESTHRHTAETASTPTWAVAYQTNLIRFLPQH